MSLLGRSLSFAATYTLLSRINFSRLFQSPLKTVGFLANSLGSRLSKSNGGNIGDSGLGGGGGGGGGGRGPSGGIGLPGLDISYKVSEKLLDSFCKFHWGSVLPGFLVRRLIGFQ